ncbi:glycosyltransferase [Zunongwangia sp. F363]|uniref:Glycosyltransferase n=1 Tax=Autumnicola tepida TaxID=3075595 RepID=A0ABU3CE08_9FLAO|nr:glycosyltransferase [Zunongwangia sp. F363]MDT0644586.1 glycosyltransferase [Zunongwangia sp. F363]
MKNSGFAAFIITYERTEILLKTISAIKNQTFPPAYLLIIDNSLSNYTEKALQEYISDSFEYYRVGYNSGPAGGANIGLEKLTNLGYDWIYWGDDNNPPRDLNVFQEMFEALQDFEAAKENPGILGGKGGDLNKLTGRLRSLSNKKLLEKKFAEVDVIPGGHTMIVNSRVIAAGCLPDEKLFFGFEEMDFCLKVKKAGFNLFVDSQTWLKIRRRDSHFEENYRWKDSGFGKKEAIKRDYYSSRNLLDIFYKNKMFPAFAILLLKCLGKSLLSFRFGWNYGKAMAKAQFSAVIHFFSGKFGKQVEL